LVAVTLPKLGWTEPGNSLKDGSENPCNEWRETMTKSGLTPANGIARRNGLADLVDGHVRLCRKTADKTSAALAIRRQKLAT